MCTLFVSTVATVATLGWEFAMHNNYHSNIRRRFHKVVNDTQVREPLGFALLMMSEVCRMAAFVATLVRAGRASLASLRCSSQEDIQGTFKAFPQTPTFASWHVVTCCDTMIHQRLLEALAVGSVQSSALFSQKSQFERFSNLFWSMSWHVFGYYISMILNAHNVLGDAG